MLYAVPTIACYVDMCMYNCMNMLYMYMYMYNMYMNMYNMHNM